MVHSTFCSVCDFIGILGARGSILFILPNYSQFAYTSLISSKNEATRNLEN